MAQTDWALNARPRPPLTAVEDAHPASLRRLPPPPTSAPHPGAVWKREKARLLPGHRGKVTCPSIACLLLGALVRCELRTSQIRTRLEVTVSKTVTGPRTHNVQWRVTETSSVNAACPPALGWCHLPQIWHAGPAPDTGLPPSPSLPAQGYPDWTWKAPGDGAAGHGRLRPQHAPRAGLPRHELLGPHSVTGAVVSGTHKMNYEVYFELWSRGSMRQRPQGALPAPRSGTGEGAGPRGDEETLAWGGQGPGEW